jgi:7-cyano-7-deazaguanine synthase
MTSTTTRKAFVLLSGGMDSTTCLYQAIYDYAPTPHAAVEHIDGTRMTKDRKHIDWVEAISVDYGQRHKKEFLFAQQTCKGLGIKHTVLHLGDILSGSGVMLTDASVAVPDISYSDIKGVSPTYVPFRNGTLLALITAYAQKWVNAEIDALVGERYGDPIMVGGLTQMQLVHDKESATQAMKDSVGIYFGAHNEDAFNWAYPDCTPEFIGAMANAIYTGSYYAIRLHTPLQWLSKADVATLGDKLGVPFEQTWSCYKGEELQCGTCPTCRARKEAFRAAGLKDPTTYAV